MANNSANSGAPDLTEPFAIGPLTISGRAFLAPMSGITDAPFRRLARSFGAALVVSEMIASGELVREKPASLKRAVDSGDGGPLMIQLAGREPHAMTEAARIARDLGAEIIDINMGCPAKKVTGGLSGAALMREPDRALALVDAVVQAVDVPVTVKMRLGWDDQNRNAPELARRAEAAGAAMITVHGRTRAQFYDGRADWSAIAQVKAAVSIPVVANGDLATLDDASEMLAQSAADAVMIGRGAQGRPWFPGQVAQYLETGRRVFDPPLEREVDIMRNHHEAMLIHYGRELGMRCARKHLGWTVARHARSGEEERSWRQRLCTATEPMIVAGLLTRFFSDVAERQAA